MRVVLAEADDIAAIVRAAEGESIVLVIELPWLPLALALAQAAVAPLAIERAPGMRVNAVVVGTGADRSAVDAAIAFLDSARSTTGQVLAVA